MRPEQDPYDVLGVTRQASRDEMKQALRRLARELHPDVAERPREGAFEEAASPADDGLLAPASRGVTPGICVACRGAGRVSTVSESQTLRYLEFATCGVCVGRGREPAPACSACGGSGSHVEQRRLRVRTLAGVRDGEELRVEGIGRRFVLEVAPRPRHSRLALAAAAAALLCALGLLASIVLR